MRLGAFAVLIAASLGGVITLYVTNHHVAAAIVFIPILPLGYVFWRLWIQEGQKDKYDSYTRERLN